MGQISHVQNEPSTCGVTRWRGGFSLNLLSTCRQTRSSRLETILPHTSFALRYPSRCKQTILAFCEFCFFAPFPWLSFNLRTHIATHLVVCPSPLPPLPPSCQSRARCHSRPLLFLSKPALSTHVVPNSPFRLFPGTASSVTTFFRPPLVSISIGTDQGVVWSEHRRWQCTVPPPLARTSHDAAKRPSPFGETVI